jgi:hypothetical protein
MQANKVAATPSPEIQSLTNRLNQLESRAP